MSHEAIDVLLIEGDADLISIVKSHLADAPEAADAFRLESAVRLSSGCHLLSRRRFDAVLIDLTLPQNVGVEGLRKVIEQRPDAPVIALAGLQERELAAEAVKAGAQDCLVKGSLERSLLRRAIRYAIDKKRLSLEIERLIAEDAAARVVVDLSGTTLFANAAAGALLGRKPEEMVRRPFPLPLEPEGPVEIDAAYTDEGTRVARKSVGNVLWNGAPARLVTLTDVTELKRLQRLGAENNERLKVVEIKSQFMNRISHELRNTLATVKTAVFCLNDGLSGSLSPRQAQFVHMISRNVDRQVKIIDNILDLARFQSGRIKVALSPVALPPLVEELSQEFKMSKRPRHVAVEFPKDLPLVLGDADLLIQVFKNLLDNAFRYARQNVSVEATVQGDEVAVSVVDDGAGIPRERIGELFTQFVQLDRPVKGAGYKGTGLGLSICKEIVEAHRGRIWAESVPGKGSRFTFVVPACRRGAPAPAPEARVTSPSKIVDTARMA